jgi:hypothetical protein
MTVEKKYSQAEIIGMDEKLLSVFRKHMEKRNDSLAANIVDVIVCDTIENRGRELHQWTQKDIVSKVAKVLLDELYTKELSGVLPFTRNRLWWHLLDSMIYSRGVQFNELGAWFLEREPYIEAELEALLGIMKGRFERLTEHEAHALCDVLRRRPRSAHPKVVRAMALAAVRHGGATALDELLAKDGN